MKAGAALSHQGPLSQISNFLLEKSRVVLQGPNERNFHVFYQLCSGATEQQKQNLGISTPDYYGYLNQSGCDTVEGIDDVQEFQDTLDAMGVMGLTEEQKVAREMEERERGGKG